MPTVVGSKAGTGGGSNRVGAGVSGPVDSWNNVASGGGRLSSRGSRASKLEPGGPKFSTGESTSSRQSVPAGPGGARFTSGGGGVGSGSAGGSRSASRSATSSSSWTSTSSSAWARSSIWCQVATPSGGGLARSRLRAWRHSFSRRFFSVGTTTEGLRADVRTPPAAMAQGTHSGGRLAPKG